MILNIIIQENNKELINITFDYFKFVKSIPNLTYLSNHNITKSSKINDKLFSYYTKLNIRYTIQEVSDISYVPSKGFTFIDTLIGYDLIHELCHYLVADIKQRNLINFGLGGSYYDELGSLFNNTNIIEESCVCFLEYIFSVYLFKIPKKYLLRRMEEANFSKNGLLDMTQVDSLINYLNTKSHIKITKC